MANSADSDQLASKPTDLDLHCLQRWAISRLSRTRVNICFCGESRNRYRSDNNTSRKHIYNFDPFKPHFYIVKLGFMYKVYRYIIFLISAQEHRLWVLIRTASVRQFQ